MKSEFQSEGRNLRGQTLEVSGVQRRPGNCQVTLFERFDEVDPRAWSQLCPPESDIFMHSGLVRATETAMAPDGRCWFALFHDAAGEPIAAAVLSSYVIDVSVMADGWTAKTLKYISHVIPRLQQVRIVFLGLPFSSGQSNVRMAPGLEETTYREIVRQLDELLIHLARRTRAEIIVVKELCQDEVKWAAALEPFGYRRADSLPMNYMPTRFESWEDYLMTLKKSKRWNMRRSQRRLLEEGISKVVCRGAEAAARFDRRAHQLYENVLFRSPTRCEHLPARFFQELARQLGDEATFFYFYKADVLVSFAVAIHSKTQFVGLYVGIDYEVNRDLELYFNLIYDSIDFGLRRRPQQLWVGANSDEMKYQKLKTYQEPRHLYVKGVSWPVKLGLKCGFGLFFPKHQLRFPKRDDSAAEPGPAS